MDTLLSPILSEDDVKRLFIPFLKGFYRDRYEPMPNSVQSSLDNVGEGGVVADGMLSFRKKDGTPFSCTFEATSRDKAGEVKYALNQVYFLWDCGAFALTCTALIYLFFSTRKLPWLISLGVTGNLGLLIGTGMIGFFTWYFMMPKWKKYRYIFAIQQFKQYGADEQWIALANDVFPSPLDPFMIELKNQCIYNGFGLALVSRADGVRLLVSPSRTGIYGKDRQMIHWVTRSQWYQSMSQGMGKAAGSRPQTPGSLRVLWNNLSRPIRYLLIDPFLQYIWIPLRKPFGMTTDVYGRFMEGQQIQKLIFFSSLLFTLFLVGKVLRHRSDDVVEITQTNKPKSGRNPEDDPGYLVNKEEVIPYNGVAPGVPKQYPTPAEKDVSTVDLSGGGASDDAPTINLSGDEPAPAPAIKTKKTAKSAAKAPAKTGKDPCSRLQGAKGWIIQDNVFSNANFASDRAKILRKHGIECAVVALSCLESGKSGHLVWIGPAQKNVGDARIKAGKYEAILQKNGVLRNNLLVRKI
jgi:cell division septation protein DedD